MPGGSLGRTLSKSSAQCEDSPVDLHPHPPPPRAHPPPLGGWGGHRRDGGVRPAAPGHRRGLVPSAVWTRHGAVEQGQSGGCVGPTDRREGKGVLGGDQGGRDREIKGTRG